MPDIVPLPADYAVLLAELKEAIVQRTVGQLPWGPNLVLLTKRKTPELPAKLQTNLPSIEAIEQALSGGDDGGAA